MKLKQQRWIVTGLLLFGMLGIFVPGFKAAAKDKVRALVITRGDYDSEYSNLSPGPENDGTNFERVLSQAYGEALTVTKLEKEGVQTVAGAAEAIRTAFADSDSEDINYFYYSGHGDVTGMWLGGDEFFNADNLAQAFSGIQGTNFLVIDCCYSGSLLARSASQDSFASRFISEFVASVKQKQSRSAITNSSFHVMVAAAQDQESMQGGLGPNYEQMGMFTAAVAVGCGVDFSKAPVDEVYACTAMADRNRDGKITFEELYAYVTGALYASDAKVYPEQDKTVFLTIGDEQMPNTVVTDVQVGRDADGKTYLEAEYQSAGDGILQGALYQCEMEEDLWDALLMSVKQEVSDYPYANFIEAGSWEFKADAGSAKAELPLDSSSLAAGEYFLLINEKEGNTGCYIFPLTLGSSAASKVLEGAAVQVKESFAVEEEETLEILADLGTGPYSNQYDCTASCEIRSQSGEEIFSFGAQKISMEYAEGNYRRFCGFQWDGKDRNGKLADAGTYTVSVSVSYGGKTQKKSQTVQVKRSSVSKPEETDKTEKIEKMEVRLSGTQFVYDGTEKCPEVSIAGLQNGRDFTVSYENNRNAGQGTVRITGMGNYSGTITRNFTILPVDVSGLDIEVQKQLSYTGKAQKAAVKAVYRDGALKEGVDYRLTYRNNKKPGYGKVTVQGIGNYSGQVTKQFKILPKTPKAQKAAGKGAASWNLRWKKAAGADGYEIQYSVKKTFKKGVKRVIIAGAKQKKAVISVPKKNKKYYFRIRSYKKVNGKKWYSAFSVFS